MPFAKMKRQSFEKEVKNYGCLCGAQKLYSAVFYGM